MPPHKTKDGSLQIWPRKRAEKILPGVNWKEIGKTSNKKGLQGFIGYKVGMTSVFVKDNTNHSMTKGKKITVPATIIECPAMKIYSVRFYKEGVVAKDVIVGFDDELKNKLKKPKKIEGKIEDEKDFEDVRIIVYSNVKTTSVKKTPDLIELALAGTNEEKIKFIKEKIGKEIFISDVFQEGLVDVRGVTTGYGFQGPMRRFGIGLKSHKSEKGRRRPGSLAPWHPARVTFRTAMAGQTGFFTRIVYNNLILQIGKIKDNNINQSGGFHKYGNIKTDFIILRGSVQGSTKRPLLMTPAIRPTKEQSKKKFEVIELRP
ncbi:MAG: 50S ribosomal protein L3 [Nanoarchaeota archaeon]|nr:50S ribosomal protein L3 [Nanoarchaeota archaeon]